MASIAIQTRPPGTAGILWAFMERQTNLWKRYWAWELVWLVYGAVNTLAVTFIAKQVDASGQANFDVSRLVLFLLIGTLVWAYLSAVLDDISLVVQWERWEGTIEHTLMAPVSRPVHLLGMCVFGVVHAVIRTSLIFLIALPFFDVSLSQADWTSAAAVLFVGSFPVAGLAILAGVLPLLYPERGQQMSMMIQAFTLLVSGVYYEVDVLPGWLKVFSAVSPATYMLDGIRGAIIDGDGFTAVWREVWALAVFGAVLIPLSIFTFSVAEHWAKKTGRLKRQG